MAARFRANDDGLNFTQLCCMACDTNHWEIKCQNGALYFRCINCDREYDADREVEGLTPE
jgi:hypothetical protein